MITLLIMGQDGSREVSSWANMAPRTDFEWSLFDFSTILNWCPIDFGLIFVRSKNRFCQMLRSILNHVRLMSDGFWTDICSILTWIGLMFTRCWDRLSSDLNKSILTLIATHIDKRAHWHLHVCNISKYCSKRFPICKFQTEHCFVTIS